MTDIASAEQVAQYLRDNPGFFDANAELLASITVPHPHGGRAVSLVERQVDLLRDKNKALEMRLAELLRIGQENDAISARLQHWTRELLRARELHVLPDRVIEGMSAEFSVPQVALRIWRVAPEHADLPVAAEVEPEVRALADSVRQPYCGPNADFRAATWLPGGGAQTRSIALLPLRVGAAPEAFGLLVLGSPDPARFQTGMGTAFLERIAEIASAALSRLLP
ncbi:MAG: hypothetical protein RJA99_2271 [Pseudomonadota bacterium]|jgi:uncharacterized protein YigA (DUF484 family)